MFKKPPLQFIGNKSRFRKEFIEQIDKYNNPEYIFIDVFGGSGYLSYLTKLVHPENKVIYNDYDGYKERVERIEETDKIINEIKDIFKNNNIEYGMMASKELSEEITTMLKRKEDEGNYVDWMTFSSQLCFTNWICRRYEDMRGHSLYNHLHRRCIVVKDYFKGLNVIKDDWKNIYNNYKDNENVVWIIDPPYPNSAQTQYHGSITMKDVCEIIDIMFNQKKVIYFCSDTSGIEDIIKWKYGDKLKNMYDKYTRRNYAGGKRQKFYEDVMFVSK